MHREACQATVYRVTKSQTQTERLAHTRLKLLLLLLFVSLYILLANPAELMLKALGILQKQSHPGGSLCQGMKTPHVRATKPEHCSESLNTLEPVSLTR